MEASGFPEANVILGPPAGLTEDEVRSLNVWRGEDVAGRGLVISCWKPTEAELEEIKKTGRVWLLVWGASMPPVCILGTHPWKG